MWFGFTYKKFKMYQGHKEEKKRVTLVVCANVTCYHKLPLMVFQRGNIVVRYFTYNATSWKQLCDLGVIEVANRDKIFCFYKMYCYSISQKMKTNSYKKNNVLNFVEDLVVLATEDMQLCQVKLIMLKRNRTKLLMNL